MPERKREAHREAVERYCATEKRSIDWSAAEFPGKHWDGREIPCRYLSGSSRRTASDGSSASSGT